MPTTPVKWKCGYANHIKHTPLTGYKSKTVSDTIRNFSIYYKNQDYHDFGHALEEFFKEWAAAHYGDFGNEIPRLRQNVIERIKFSYWFENPDLEYFQLTEAINQYDRNVFNDEFTQFLLNCASSHIKNDVPLTTPITNDNIGFV